MTKVNPTLTLILTLTRNIPPHKKFQKVPKLLVLKCKCYKLLDLSVLSKLTWFELLLNVL